MRRFEIHLHQVVSYLGMIKYHHSHPKVLALGMKKQAEILCEQLQNIPEIRELRICCDGGDAGSREVLPIALEPFWALKNTHVVHSQGSELDKAGVQAKLQSHLQRAYAKNSLLRLPRELRQAVYRLIIPYTTTSPGSEHKSAVLWHRDDVSILRMSKAVYSEAIQLL